MFPQSLPPEPDQEQPSRTPPEQPPGSPGRRWHPAFSAAVLALVGAGVGYVLFQIGGSMMGVYGSKTDYTPLLLWTGILLRFGGIAIIAGVVISPVILMIRYFAKRRG